MEGCPKCGKHKIIKNRGDGYREDEKLMENKTIDENIAVFVRGSGEYIINLDNLTKLDDDQPLLIEDSTGKVNVLFNPDD